MLPRAFGGIDASRVYRKMPPKQVARSLEDDKAHENEAAWHESKRLQQLAYKGVSLLPLQLDLHGPTQRHIHECESCVTKQMLSETRRMCTEEAAPSKGKGMCPMNRCKDALLGLQSDADTSNGMQCY